MHEASGPPPPQGESNRLATGKQLYVVTAGVLGGQALAMACNAKSRKGWELWRQLSVDDEPARASTALGQMTELLIPRLPCPEASHRDRLMPWKRQIKDDEAQHSRKFGDDDDDDSMKRAIIIAKTPEALRSSTHMQSRCHTSGDAAAGYASLRVAPGLGSGERRATRWATWRWSLCSRKARAKHSGKKVENAEYSKGRSASNNSWPAGTYSWSAGKSAWISWDKGGKGAPRKPRMASQTHGLLALRKDRALCFAMSREGCRRKWAPGVRGADHLYRRLRVSSGRRRRALLGARRITGLPWLARGFFLCRVRLRSCPMTSAGLCSTC